MQFDTPLITATLIRRYKRFLADAKLPDTREITAHCANPGAMTGLAEGGTEIWLEPNDDPKKKLNYGWRLVDLGDGHLAVVDTGIANKVVKEALLAGDIPELAAYDSIRPEVRYGAGSRIDFLLSGVGKPDLYLEVKSVTLSRRRGLAEFPDTTTKRGAKHLEDLAQMVREGHRAMMLYLVMRSDCDRATLAGDIDPTYCATYAQARDTGVETMAYGAAISPQAITVGRAMPFIAPLAL